MSEQAASDSVTLPLALAARAASAPAPARFGVLWGASPAMREVYRRIDKVAHTSVTVLLCGESGSGKELVARTLHDRSDRGGEAFVAVNCGAIPANLIEAELFGYEKGAFTGATRQHRGCFERAEGGTLFLDEITEMAPEMQVRLLRVLETGTYHRVGGEDELCARARIIAATNRDPQQAVREGRLREDLLYRIAVFPFLIPPLRKRDGDAELLAERFLGRLNEEAGTRKAFTCQATATIRAYPWPGNVRELRNAVHRAFILSDDAVDLDFGGLAGEDTDGDCLRIPVGTALAEIERRVIYATLDHCGGQKKRCAEILGISVKTLYNRLAAYQEAPRDRPRSSDLGLR